MLYQVTYCAQMTVERKEVTNCTNHLQHLMSTCFPSSPAPYVIGMVYQQQSPTSGLRWTVYQHYSVDFIFLSFGIMGFIVEL